MTFPILLNRFQQAREKLRQHEKLKHPASREQFEDIWEQEDGMSEEDFDPKTFFHLHGNFV